MPELKAFSRPLDINALATVIASSVDEVTSSGGVAGFPVEVILDLPDSIDVENVEAQLGEATTAVGRGDRRPAESDAVVVSLIHKPLRELPREVAARPGFWTWLACSYGRDYVWKRWLPNETKGDDPDEVAALLSKGGRQSRYSMRAASLNGVSRHALARLWWLGDSVQGDYELAARILHNQDIFQAIYERRVGFISNLPAILSHEFCLGDKDKKLSGEEFREKVMTTLNQLATVTQLETLDETQLRELVSEVRRERLPKFGQA